MSSEIVNMNSEIIYIGRLLLATLIGICIGQDRERWNKPCGLRTVTFVILGATMVALMTLKYDLLNINNNFDAMRAIAYYLVAIGFVGGGIINRYKGKVEGITTAALLLPLTVTGILCGLGEYFLASISFLLIYFILKLKYIKVNFHKRKK